MDYIATRLYYSDSYTWQFDANIIETGAPDGESFAVLDATYFYPTSGGQPHDVGALGSAIVTDVRVRDADGALLHILDKAVEQGTTPATIDGNRRFDHMQQHTGQHVLSQAFLRAADAKTIGFHLGTETVSIDLDATNLTDAAIDDALSIANGVITGNIEVRAWFPSPSEIETLALRKMPDVDGPLRVVAIGDFDYSACGGTHVARAGEVGLLSILRTEKMKRGTRIEFLAGNRARADYARKHRIIRELSSALTCAPAEIADAVTKLQGTLTEVRRKLSLYHERDLEMEAETLADDAAQAGPIRIVRQVWRGRSIDDVKTLALKITAEPDMVALFAVAGPRTQLLFARSENVTTDLKPSFQSALSALGDGKGGGARVLMGSAAAADEPTLIGILSTAKDALA